MHWKYTISYLFLVHCILGFKIKQRKIMPIKLNIDVYFYFLKDTYIFKLGFLFNRVILQELGLWIVQSNRKRTWACLKTLWKFSYFVATVCKTYFFKAQCKMYMVSSTFAIHTQIHVALNKTLYFDNIFKASFETQF